MTDFPDMIRDVVGDAAMEASTLPPMHINAAGLAIIKRAEGLRLKAYPDPATGGDPWTIGYGSTLEVHPGLTITEAQAEARLAADLQRFEVGVFHLVKDATSNQFSALVSLSFNIGLANLAKSTLLKKHNAGDYAGAQAQFAVWNKALGKPMEGLRIRRADEADLYGRKDA